MLVNMGMWNNMKRLLKCILAGTQHNIRQLDNDFDLLKMCKGQFT